MELLQRHVLPAVLRDIGAATKAAWQSDSGQPLRERLLAVVEKIAEFTYYLFNGALYTRGLGCKLRERHSEPPLMTQFFMAWTSVAGKGSACHGAKTSGVGSSKLSCMVA